VIFTEPPRHEVAVERSWMGEGVWAPRVFLIVAILLQLQAGFALLPGDLLADDPPAHFITGVMLYDFLHPGHTLRPMRFAECFYVHYPKVAFGHWPPVFYVVEAAWFFIFGARIVAARWLCAAITAGCALILYRSCRNSWGRSRAIAAAALFLALPVVRQQTWIVMSDLLLAGLVFLSIRSLGDYLTNRTARCALSVAGWTSLAILTKGTGWLLLVLIAAGPVVVGRRGLYLSRTYWLAILLPCAISAPFYFWMSALDLGYPFKMPGHLHRLAVILSRFSAGEWALGALALVIAVAATWRCLPQKTLTADGTLIVLFAVWGLTMEGFIALVPLTADRRYFVAFIAPAVYLLAAALSTLERWLESRRFGTAQSFAVLLCACGFAFIPMQLESTSAFSRIMSAIPAGNGRRIILVESDSSGEGAMIAARLTQEPSRSSQVLRGSKFLASSEWSGAQYSLRYESTAALRTALESVRLDYAVLDTSAVPRPEAVLLREVLQDPGSKWEAVARVSVEMKSRQGDLLVYRRQSGEHSSEAPYPVQLGPENGYKTLTCSSW
jgi:hypothetical protein